MPITMQELLKKLEEKIPQNAVEQRDGGSGKKLSYLTGHYVIDRLNQTIGQGFWSYAAKVHKLHEGEIEGRYGKSFYVSYMAEVNLRVKFPNGEICDYQDAGFGDGQDKANPGKSHELAIKEAITDGLKRCARVLGNSMGNGLYDKSGDGVEQEQVAPSKGVEASRTASREQINSLITSTARVLISKNLLTKDEITATMEKKYGKVNKEQLTGAEAAEFLVFLTEKTR